MRVGEGDAPGRGIQSAAEALRAPSYMRYSMTSENPLEYSDLLLPNQAFLRRDFRGDDCQLHRSILDAIISSTELTTPVEDFDLVTSTRFTVEEMASPPTLLRLLQFLIRVSGARSVLEIGAFIGVSTMSMARALPRGGKIVSIEKFSEFADICRQNFRRNGLDDRITLMLGDALEVLPTLSGKQTFDFVFLDGNKERYVDYFDLVDPMVPPGGLVVVDNMFCCGDVLNEPPATEKGAGVKRFLDLAHHRRDYFRLMLPIYDGVMIMQKNSG
jgi:predicted O-methyltransferase YrrM